MRHLLFIPTLALSLFSFSQRIELIDTSGNRFLGTIVSETDTSVSIETKNKHILYFDSAQYIDYGKYTPFNRSLPLTKALDPFIIAQDVGFILRPAYPDAGLFYALSFQKRITDHLSAGLQGSIGIGGDFLDLNLRAISTYQFNPLDRYVHNISLSAGPLKEVAYWSEGGFDVNASYTLLMRREWSKSRRLTFSTGLYSAKFNTCLDADCNVEGNIRDNLLQLRISYGWQF